MVGTAGEHFGKMSVEELRKWQDTYTTLIWEHGPESSKNGKTPHMIVHWQRGLDMVNELLKAKGGDEWQLSMF